MFHISEIEIEIILPPFNLVFRFIIYIKSSLLIFYVDFKIESSL